MRIITAYVRHFKVDQICETLWKLKYVKNIFITEVKSVISHRISADQIDLVPKCRIDVLCSQEDQLEFLVYDIEKLARTGQVGDGIIFCDMPSHQIFLDMDDRKKKK